MPSAAPTDVVCKRVEIWWEDDACWYPGYVADKRERAKTSNNESAKKGGKDKTGGRKKAASVGDSARYSTVEQHIKYDDDQEEWIALSEHRWRLEKASPPKKRKLVPSKLPTEPYFEQENSALHELQNLWELPCLGHLLWLLNLPAFSLDDFEMAILQPQESAFLSNVANRIFCENPVTVHLEYFQWNEILHRMLHLCYEEMGRLERKANFDDSGVLDVDTYGDEFVDGADMSDDEQLGLLFLRSLLAPLGNSDPMDKKDFHELPAKLRVLVLKTACEWVFEKTSIQDELRELNDDDNTLSILPVGKDANAPTLYEQSALATLGRRY